MTEYDEPFGHHLKISASHALRTILAQICVWAGYRPSSVNAPFGRCWLLKAGEGQAVTRSYTGVLASARLSPGFAVLALPVWSGWQKRLSSELAADPRLTRREPAPRPWLKGWETPLQSTGHAPAQAAGVGVRQVENNLYVPLKENMGLWLRNACSLPAGRGRGCSQPGTRLPQMEQKPFFFGTSSCWIPQQCTVHRPDSSC